MKHKDTFLEKHGVKLGFMSGFLCASAAAMREVPVINAVIDDEAQEIVYRDYMDVSVAVATPTGLMTPVLRNVVSRQINMRGCVQSPIRTLNVSSAPRRSP